jgi:hypothetical protein
VFLPTEVNTSDELAVLVIDMPLQLRRGQSILMQANPTDGFTRALGGKRGDRHTVNRRHVHFSERRRVHMYDGAPVATAFPISCDMDTVNCCRPDRQPVQYGG